MASVDEILDAIRTVAGGGSAYPIDARRSAKDALRVPTQRELEILSLVAEGLSNVEIAERLSLRVKTVESQLRRLFDRYDVDQPDRARPRSPPARAGSSRSRDRLFPRGPLTGGSSPARSGGFSSSQARDAPPYRPDCEVSRVDHHPAPPGLVSPLAS